MVGLRLVLILTHRKLSLTMVKFLYGVSQVLYAQRLYFDFYTYELAPSSDRNRRFQVDIRNQRTQKPN